MTPLLSPAQRFEDLPLRERKMAQTRKRFIEAAMERMEETPFPDLRVADLCRDIGVSQPTFFNYFPTKGHLLVHIILLRGLEAAWHADRWAQALDAQGTIAAIFAFYGQAISNAPRVAAELFAHQARRMGPPRFPAISRADRLLWFPELEGIEDTPTVGILGVLRPQVRRALERHELPAHLDPESVLTALATVFFGVPLTVLSEKPETLSMRYEEQLAVVWRGLAERRVTAG